MLFPLLLLRLTRLLVFLVMKVLGGLLSEYLAFSIVENETIAVARGFVAAVYSGQPVLCRHKQG